MPFFLYDGDCWSPHPDLATAEAQAREAIKAARDAAKFDREWPDWVGEIRIHEGVSTLEDGPSALPCVMRAVEVNIERPSSELDEDGYDSEYNWWESPDAYACDFDLAAPAKSN